MNTSKTVQQSNLSNIGIDVSKKTVHIVALKGKKKKKKNFKYDTVPNNIEDVVAYFSENFKVENVGCIVMEATGGYEKKVANTLAKMGYYVSIINPRRSHNWMDALEFRDYLVRRYGNRFSFQERTIYYYTRKEE